MPKIAIDYAVPTICSIGGSLVVPNGGPNVDFLKTLATLIRSEVKKGRTFVLVVGGGKTSRHYIDAANAVHHITNEDLDWLGIHATRLNGHLLRTIFDDIAHPVVIKNPLRVPRAWQGKVLIAAGWKPGWSTDYVACRIAKALGSNKVINASNIDHVYSEDPRKNPKADKFETMHWKDYRKLVGDTWDPGLSAPFDPIASKFCHRHKLQVAIVNGEPIDQLKNAILGKEFIGTLIS